MATKRALLPDEKLAKFRKIVAESQHQKVEGVLVDVASAQAIITVHDALKGALREKFLNMPVGKMGSAAWTIIGKYGK
jgi:hypothetical protein